MLAQGDLVTCQDADDWSHPDRFARQVAALQARSGWQAVLPHWVRADDGLQPSALRPDIGLIHPCLSGLMLRRSVMARLGFWDRVRAGADTEYLARLIRLQGDDAVGRLLPDVPLAFGRITPGSLTQEATTGLLGGLSGSPSGGLSGSLSGNLSGGAAARTAYLVAARAWHDSGADLCLPAYPDRRPFAVPPALALPGDPSGPETMVGTVAGSVVGPVA